MVWIIGEKDGTNNFKYEYPEENEFEKNVIEHTGDTGLLFPDRAKQKAWGSRLAWSHERVQFKRGHDNHGRCGDCWKTWW